jgi:Flp pilus assembly protein TadG
VAAAPMTTARRAGAALRRRHRLLREDGRDGEGGYSVLEASITLPIIILLLMMIVQWAIVWHTRNIANAAAQEALRTTEQYNSTATAGRQDGETYIAQVAPHVLPSGCVSVQRTATTATVHVHCKITMSVVPFGTYWVDETVTGPIERFGG